MQHWLDSALWDADAVRDDPIEQIEGPHGDGAGGDLCSGGDCGSSEYADSEADDLKCTESESACNAAQDFIRSEAHLALWIGHRRPFAEPFMFDIGRYARYKMRRGISVVIDLNR